MDELNGLGTLGLTLPTPAYLAGALLFGLIGFAAWRYGKKAGRSYPRWLGVGLMLYPYGVSRTWLLWLVGTVLCVALYFFRND